MARGSRRRGGSCPASLNRTGERGAITGVRNNVHGRASHFPPACSICRVPDAVPPTYAPPAIGDGLSRAQNEILRRSGAKERAFKQLVSRREATTREYLSNKKHAYSVTSWERERYYRVSMIRLEPTRELRRSCMHTYTRHSLRAKFHLSVSSRYALAADRSVLDARHAIIPRIFKPHRL